jgi:hypothetical protein
MGIIEMVAEGIAGAGFWSPVVFIAATVEREVQVVPVPMPFLPYRWSSDSRAI